jgi:hypothetical protein
MGYSDSTSCLSLNGAVPGKGISQFPLPPPQDSFSSQGDLGLLKELDGLWPRISYLRRPLCPLPAGAATLSMSLGTGLVPQQGLDTK